MSDRAHSAAAERQQLQAEVEMLQSMSSDTATAAEIEAREDRIASLEAGATPRGLRGGTQGQEEAPSAPALNQEQIHEIFEFYANFGRSAVMTYQDSLDSFMFMKFARECPGLLDGDLSKTEVDLIFTKAKPKFERRLDFEHFLDALSAISDRKYPDYAPADGLRQLLANHLAPHYEIVLNEMSKTGDTEVPLSGIFKKLYDVRSYTGVYAERFRTGDGRINGDTESRTGKYYMGNTNTATDEIIHDISVLMRPNLRGAGTMMSPANHVLARKTGATGRSAMPSPTLSRHQGGAGGSPHRAGPSRPGSAGSPRPFSSSLPRRSLAGTGGLSIAPGGPYGSPSGGSTAGGRTPAPTPAGPSSRSGTSVRGSAPVGGGSIVLDTQAEELLAALSKARATGDASQLMELTQQLASAATSSAHHPGSPQAPRSSPTASYNRFNRSASSARGSSSPAGSVRQHPHPLHTQELDGGSVVSGGGGVPPSPALNQEQIHEIFEFYANFGRSAVMTYQDSLDSFMFMKFARECPNLIDPRSLSQTEVDLIFVKAKPKSERRLLFSHFLDALSAIAERKYPEYSPADGLRLLLANHLAPHYEIVLNEMSKTGDTEIPLSGIYKKLYDVRSYTGVYAERFRTGDGRINGDADNRPGRSFLGNTNTATDEIIHDISVLMRPNLRSGSMMTTRTVTPGGSPRATGRSSSALRGASASRRNSIRSPSVGRGGGGSVAGGY